MPGDLPTTRQIAMPNIAAQEAVGVTFDGTLLVSGRDEQAAYTPAGPGPEGTAATTCTTAPNDVAMIRMQKEAQAQGVDTEQVIVGLLARLLHEEPARAGRRRVEGTYVWMQFLPFEEADTNAALQAYVDTVGADKVDSFGAQAWQAAIAFQQVVNQIVADEGPNAITRAKILEGFDGLDDFTADGWAGARSLRERLAVLRAAAGPGRRVRAGVAGGARARSTAIPATSRP